jgi:SAM-dependent methyltransferase
VAQFGQYYYSHDCGIPYERNAHWLTFFGQVADRLVHRFQPHTSIDAGCALGILVETMRDRGVEAYGFDVSKYALEQAHESVSPYCFNASLADPWPDDLPARVDLVTCIEVIEHLSKEDEAAALDNLCARTDRVFFTSSPLDYAEPTHINVNPSEYWAARFAERGFVRNLDALDLLGGPFPWAAVYERSEMPVSEVVRRYERAYWLTRQEVSAVRQTIVSVQNQLEQTSNDELERLRSEIGGWEAQVDALREQLLVARDTAIGAELELGEALGRMRMLDQEVARYTDAAAYLDRLFSTSLWRAAKPVLAVARKVRRRLAR